VNTVKIPVVKFSGVENVRAEDYVSMEEPLEIFIDDEPYYITMRLPGEEMPLAIGLCFTEGVINSMDDVKSVNYCGDLSSNKINMYLSDSRKNTESFKLKQKRSTTYSSCGICGKDMIEDICTSLKPTDKRVTIEFSKILKLQQIVEEKQEVFRVTGGTHAAGIFSAKGDLLSLSEDIGRHNALDKAIGKLLLSKQINEAAIIILTSRLSYEMVQKAARLGVEIIGGASSTTSLAVEIARTLNLTLIGFLRKNRGNIYSCPERIINNTIT
jgi:FdhD protein